jgi:hypothetical protein
MKYLLARAILVLLGWGFTYGLIVALSTDFNPALFCFTGIGWTLAGLVCFGYIRKLRRQAALAENATEPNVQSLDGRAVA